VELIGTDKNTTHIDNAAVNITSTLSSSEGFWLYLLETGLNTGKYRGSFKISDRTHKHLKLINATIGENVIVSSVMDQTKNATILVTTMVQLGPQQDKTTAIEDEKYFMHYWNFGFNAISEWTFDTNASWLIWDDVSHDIFGTPNNGYVGTYWVRINITDGLGNFDEHNFTLTVKNTPPEITTENLIIAKEDELYYMDYTSSDDGNGTITWYLDTNTSWLELDLATGELSGTPTNDDRGIHKANVSVYDGNGGRDWSYFEITVVDTNDAPVIITENITTVYEDEYYFVQYNATDIDGENSFDWFLDTNASWLNIDKDSGELSGTPNNDHVGSSYVNISVKDPRDSSDSQNFTLEVININDPPEWVTVPDDTDVAEGETFAFDVNATDIDAGEVLTYYLNFRPIVDITIDPNTGLIKWIANIDNLSAPEYKLEVIVLVSDGEELISSTFNITVLPNPKPTTELLIPANNSIISSIGIELKWIGFDESGEPLSFDVYLSYSKTSIIELAEGSRVLHDTNATSYSAKELKLGGTYYWTVIPHDGRKYGICLDGIFSFEINTPPEISEISKQKATVGFEFRLEVEAIDTSSADIRNFQYNLKDAPDGMVIEPVTGVITWTPIKEHLGKHTISVLLSDGIDQSNITFEIEVIEKEVGKESSNPTFVIYTIFIIIIIITVNIGVAGTEVGKYKFLSLFFVPLYNKLHPDNILNNFLRGRIYGYISAKPGENYNSIKKALELNNGTLAHHARVLEKEEYIYSKRDGFYTRFYPKDTKPHEINSPQLTELQQNMVELIRTQPGITQHELVPLLNASQPDVSYNITKLSRDDMIIVERNGRENRYYLNYEGPKSTQDQVQAVNPVDAKPTIESTDKPKEIPSLYRYPKLPPPESRTDQETQTSIESEFDN
jgi:predicted transcriptional regulator